MIAEVLFISTLRAFWLRLASLWAAKREPPRRLTLKERLAATEPEIKRETAA